ncbi:MAG: hypothetical protein ACJAUY_001375 [Cognaticolwellia sp.]|jgi:hypothetical protein
MEILSNLSVYLSNPRTSLNNKLLKICSTIKSAIPECDRVGIWLFCSDYSEMFSLICLDEYGKQTMGEHLLASNFKDYFSHIIENEFLVASDARNNDVSKCFNKGYFDVHNIHSLLDVTFKKDFVPLGIICCERTGDQVEWQTADIKTLKKIAVKASLFISDNVSETYSSKSKENIINILSE